MLQISLVVCIIIHLFICPTHTFNVFPSPLSHSFKYAKQTSPTVKLGNVFKKQATTTLFRTRFDLSTLDFYRQEGEMMPITVVLGYNHTRAYYETAEGYELLRAITLNQLLDIRPLIPMAEQALGQPKITEKHLPNPISEFHRIRKLLPAKPVRFDTIKHFLPVRRRYTSLTYVYEPRVNETENLVDWSMISLKRLEFNGIKIITKFNPEVIPETPDNTTSKQNVTEDSQLPYNGYQGGDRPPRKSVTYTKGNKDDHSIYDPAYFRMQIVTVVTQSETNRVALDLSDQVYDYIRNKTNNDKRIVYRTYVCTMEDENNVTLPLQSLENNLQMWLESYNTYHLIDGYAMKKVWGTIVPSIILDPKNLDAIVEKVNWALYEDGLDGTLLSPRMSNLRLNGPPAPLADGFNTQVMHNEFSVVNVD